jgi:hypothetical protein
MSYELDESLHKASSTINGQLVDDPTSRSIAPAVPETNDLLEDLHIPDSRLIDGDTSELALLGRVSDDDNHSIVFVFADPSTFDELHKAAECLLNLQGVFYFGEEDHGTERSI